jgi:hypothetical protein
MQYLLLIYGNEGRWNKVDAPEREQALQEFGAFTQGIHQSGHLRGGNELDRTSKAATVRVRDGKAHRHRRSFRRNQGTVGRLLPD